MSILWRVCNSRSLSLEALEVLEGRDGIFSSPGLTTVPVYRRYILGIQKCRMMYVILSSLAIRLLWSRTFWPGLYLFAPSAAPILGTKWEKSLGDLFNSTVAQSWSLYQSWNIWGEFITFFHELDKKEAEEAFKKRSGPARWRSG